MDARMWGRVTGGVVVGLVVVIALVVQQQARQEWRAPKIVAATRTAETTPAVTEPKMIPVPAVTADYFEDVEGIAVEINGDARFYSFQILNWHEIVLDTVGGTPIAVTYSTLCGSSAVYANTGSLKLSGYMQDTCSIVENEQGTQYLQPTGKKIAGTGSEELQRIPSAVMQFDDWYPQHPNGLVLSLQTGFERVYSRHPLGDYDTSDRIVGAVSVQEDVLPVKDIVWDVLTLAGARTNVGIARSLLSRDLVQNISGDWGSAVALLDNRTAMARIFESTVDGQVLNFVPAERPGQFMDEQTGSLWNAEGEAIAGRYKGTMLAEMPTNRAFGFVYRALFPQAVVPGYETAKAAQEAAPEQEPVVEGETVILE